MADGPNEPPKQNATLTSGGLSESSRDERIRRDVGSSMPTRPRARSSVIPPPGNVPEPMAELGRGGMGTVSLVFDEPLSREVAVKRLHPEHAHDEDWRQEFIQEARIAGQLQHPNIVPVYALASDESSRPFFTMQVVDGRTFSEWLAGAGPSAAARGGLQEGLEILMRVCDALSFAHSRKVLHLDVKPSNIMVGPHGRVYLMDWGLAMRLDEQEDLGNAGVAGTPAYMPPEQARGCALDERADVFAVGAVLCELVSGRTPYGEDGVHFLAMAFEGKVRPLTAADCATLQAPMLLEIINKAIAPDAGERYSSIAELQDALRSFLRGGFDLPRQAFAPGEVIIKQGEPGHCAYLIVSGSCRVIRSRPEGAEELPTMKAGEIFGELAILLNSPRSATVIADEPTTLLVIGREALEARGVLDGWSSTLLAALARRFLSLEERANA